MRTRLASSVTEGNRKPQACRHHDRFVISGDANQTLCLTSVFLVRKLLIVVCMNYTTHHPLRSPSFCGEYHASKHTVAKPGLQNERELPNTTTSNHNRAQLKESENALPALVLPQAGLRALGRAEALHAPAGVPGVCSLVRARMRAGTLSSNGEASSAVDNMS